MLDEKEKAETSSSSSYEGAVAADAGSGSLEAAGLFFLTAVRRRTGGFLLGSGSAAGLPTFDLLGGALRRAWPMEAGSEDVAGPDEHAHRKSVALP